MHNLYQKSRRPAAPAPKKPQPSAEAMKAKKLYRSSPFLADKDDYASPQAAKAAAQYRDSPVSSEKPRHTVERTPIARQTQQVAVEKGIPVTRTEVKSPSILHKDFKLPNGVTVSHTKMMGFKQVLHDTAMRLHESGDIGAELERAGQELLSFHLQEMREAFDRFEKQRADMDEQRRGKWADEFISDRDIGGNRQNTTLERANALLALYGKAVGMNHLKALRTLLSETGVGNHRELIRFCNWAGAALVRDRHVAPSRKAA
jgi:hypothetical protein